MPLIRSKRRCDGARPPPLASLRITLGVGDQLHQSLFDQLIHQLIEVVLQFIGVRVELALERVESLLDRTVSCKFDPNPATRAVEAEVNTLVGVQDDHAVAEIPPCDAIADFDMPRSFRGNGRRPPAKACGVRKYATTGNAVNANNPRGSDSAHLNLQW